LAKIAENHNIDPRETTTIFYYFDAGKNRSDIEKKRFCTPLISGQGDRIGLIFFTLGSF
jgi:hypothetical protein